MRSVISKIVYAAMLPALVAGGIAIAKSGDSNDQRSNDVQRAPHAALPAPPVLMGNLTYAEIHAQRNGDEVVIRIDRGKVKSVASDSVTITENNGSDVTVPVNDDTRVLLGAPPRKGFGKLSDLKEGQTVVAHREAGKAASVIAVPPRAGEGPPGPPPFGRRGWHRSGELPAPPPLPDANP